MSKKYSSIRYKQGNLELYKKYLKYVDRMRKYKFRRKDIVLGLNEKYDIPLDELENMSLTSIYIKYPEESEEYMQDELDAY